MYTGWPFYTHIHYISSPLDLDHTPGQPVHHCTYTTCTHTAIHTLHVCLFSAHSYTPFTLPVTHTGSSFFIPFPPHTSGSSHCGRYMVLFYFILYVYTHTSPSYLRRFGQLWLVRLHTYCILLHCISTFWFCHTHAPSVTWFLYTHYHYIFHTHTIQFFGFICVWLVLPRFPTTSSATYQFYYTDIHTFFLHTTYHSTHGSPGSIFWTAHHTRAPHYCYHTLFCSHMVWFGFLPTLYHYWVPYIRYSWFLLPYAQVHIHIPFPFLPSPLYHHLYLPSLYFTGYTPHFLLFHLWFYFYHHIYFLPATTLVTLIVLCGHHAFYLWTHTFAFSHFLFPYTPLHHTFYTPHTTFSLPSFGLPTFHTVHTLVHLSIYHSSCLTYPFFYLLHSSPVHCYLYTFTPPIHTDTTPAYHYMHWFNSPCRTTTTPAHWFTLPPLGSSHLPHHAMPGRTTATTTTYHTTGTHCPHCPAHGWFLCHLPACLLPLPFGSYPFYYLPSSIPPLVLTHPTATTTFYHTHCTLHTRFLSATTTCIPTYLV